MRGTGKGAGFSKATTALLPSDIRRDLLAEASAKVKYPQSVSPNPNCSSFAISGVLTLVFDILSFTLSRPMTSLPNRRFRYQYSASPWSW